MIRDRMQDSNGLNGIRSVWEVFLTPDGRVVTKTPGELVTERWNYLDNPIDGIGEKEFAGHFRFFENRFIPCELGVIPD